MKVLFWLYRSRPNRNEEFPTYVRITINSKREQFTTGLFIDPRNWNPDKQRLKGRTEYANAINQTLDKIEIDLLGVFNKMSEVFNNVSARDVRSNYLDEDQLRGMSLFWSQWMHQYYDPATIAWLRMIGNVQVIRAAMGVDEDGGYAHNPGTEQEKSVQSLMQPLNW